MKSAHRAPLSQEKTSQHRVWAGFWASACLLVLAIAVAPAHLSAQAQYPDEQVIPDHVDKYTKTN